MQLLNTNFLLSSEKCQSKNKRKSSIASEGWRWRDDPEKWETGGKEKVTNGDEERKINIILEGEK